MRYAAILFLALALAGCGPSTEQLQATVTAAISETQVAATTTAVADVCGAEKLSVYADAIEKQIDRFIRQTLVTSAAPRVSMGVPMQELLNLQNETDDLAFPPCLEDYHQRVVSNMGLYLVAYQNFAAQGNETVTVTTMGAAEKTMKELREQLEMIKQGQIPSPTEPTSTP